MKHCLVSWLGTVDIKCVLNSSAGEIGPLLSVLRAHDFSEIHLLSNRPPAETNAFVEAFQRKVSAISVIMHQYSFEDPTDYEQVLSASENAISKIKPFEANKQITFFVTPGTPIMVAVFCLLAERLPGVALIQHSEQNGTRAVDWRVPDYLTKESAKEINDNIGIDMPPDKAFSNILHASAVMRGTIRLASRYARHDIRILLAGESGTGKELFARAIHDASGRKGQFVAVNCGAIPVNLLESELFGFEKGAFTGAVAANIGKIRSANNGTLFLDEIGELPLDQQVKLLRFLQEGEITPIGGRIPQKVDVKIISATHRDLPEMMQTGKFREDLYYRLAVGLIRIPPLRERGNDLFLLAQECLRRTNEMLFPSSPQECKQFCNDVNIFIANYPWFGNFRELDSTILRAVLNTGAKEINASDLEASILIKRGSRDVPDWVPEYRGDGSFVLDNALEDIEKYYIRKALEDAHGIKQKAAELLGWKTHQNLSNRLKKYDLE